MDNFLSTLNLPNLDNQYNNLCNGLDINKILIILLLLTGKINIESISFFPNDFTITLGTFTIR